MNTNPRTIDPAKKAVFAFLAIMGAMMAFAAAMRTGYIESGFERRSIGLLVGVMIVLTGNLLPKLRPLSSAGKKRVPKAKAERFAGWSLVLAGLLYCAFFLFVPLHQARVISSIVGIVTLSLIAAGCAWLARRTVSGTPHQPEENPGPTECLQEKRKIVFWLLFASLYVFTTACAAFLFGDRPTFRESASWILIGFSVMYAVLATILNTKPKSRNTISS